MKPLFLLRLSTRSLLFAVALCLASGDASHAAAVKPKKKDRGAAAEEPQGPATPPADSSPMADLKKSNAAIKKIVQKQSQQSPSWSPEAEAKNAELRKTVADFL